MNEMNQDHPAALRLTICLLLGYCFSMYLINSPIVRGENLKFNEEGVNEVVKTVLLPWFHAYRFLQQSIAAYDRRNDTNSFRPDPTLYTQTNNIMDKWILSATQGLVENVRKGMKGEGFSLVLSLLLIVEQRTRTPPHHFHLTHTAGAAYQLYTVIPELVGFIGQLTNWYVRLNRQRLKVKTPFSFRG